MKIWSRLKLGLIAVAFAFFTTLASAKAENTPIILVLGDSLTAGYNLPQEHAFPPVLQAHLAEMGKKVIVRNGGISGDTSAGGRARLDWTLNPKPDAVIVELGANDALRALPPEYTYKNLKAIIQSLQNKGIAVLLAGMKAPRNYGDDYAAQFDAVYPQLAKEMQVPLYPFFMDGVITALDGTVVDPLLIQDDGLHPTYAGVQVMVKHITPYVLQLLNGKNK